jgi:hypothetical protein
MRCTPVRCTPMRHTHEVHAYKVHAHEVHAYEIYTYKIYAHETRPPDPHPPSGGRCELSEIKKSRNREIERCANRRMGRYPRPGHRNWPIVVIYTLKRLVGLQQRRLSHTHGDTPGPSVATTQIPPLSVASSFSLGKS